MNYYKSNPAPAITVYGLMPPPAEIPPILKQARFTDNARPEWLNTWNLSPFEVLVFRTAKEKSTLYPRDHIVLIWPDEMAVDWYPESRVRNPAQLADWLERCYCSCIKWLNVNPNQLVNAGKGSGRQARLLFVHDGMWDFNYDDNFPRPVIGLRDFSGVGSENWFGWLSHELSHEFLWILPEVVGTPEDNAWHEALADYLRYWILKESGMPAAAARWGQALQVASPYDRYRGGARAVMAFHEVNSLGTPGDLWRMIRGKGVSRTFGRAPWLK